MKRLLRIVLTAAILLVGIGVVWRVVQAQQQTPDPETDPNAEILDSAVVERGDLTVTVSATGDVAPARDVDLLFEVSAPVLEVLVEEGQQVRAGDVLARLDTRDLEAAVEDAEVALEFQRVAYDQLLEPAREEDIAAAEAAVNAALAAQGAASQGADAEAIEIARLQAELARNQLWQSQLDRDRTMDRPAEFRGGSIGAPATEIQLNSGLESAEFSITINEANYAALVNEGPDQAALGSATAQLVQAQVSLDRLLDGATELELQQADVDLQQAELRIQQARATLDKAALVAPFDGVIAQNNLVVGEVPPAALPAMLLLDMNELNVDLEIDETDIVQVENGQAVRFSFDALNTNDIDGTVARVAITPTEGQGQLVTYEVRAAVDDTDAPLRVGMTATATIIVSELSDVLIVPNRFIRIDRASGDAYITVETDEGVFEEVMIELGLRNDTTSQVVSGLNEGQTIVLLPRDTFNPFGG